MEQPPNLSWSSVVTWLFCGGWSFIAVHVASSLSKLSVTMTEVKASISALNTNVAVVFEKVGGHEKRFEQTERRIDKLEENR